MPNVWAIPGQPRKRVKWERVSAVRSGIVVDRSLAARERGQYLPEEPAITTPTSPRLCKRSGADHKNEVNMVDGPWVVMEPVPDKQGHYQPISGDLSCAAAIEMVKTLPDKDHLVFQTPVGMIRVTELNEKHWVSLILPNTRHGVDAHI
jgi:hypothetical protein